MKKTLLVFLAIALVSSFAFAEVTGAGEPDVTASLETKFGYSLDNESSGFQNDADIDIVVNLVNGPDTHSGEGDVYAEITVEDLEIKASTDDEDWSWDASVSAKIVAGNFYVGIGNPDLDFNKVDLDNDLQVDEAGDNDEDMDIDVNADVAGADGISFGYVTDAFSFEVGIASKNDAYLDDDDKVALVVEDDTTSWFDSNEEDEIDVAGEVDSNNANEYVLGINASFKAGPATIPVFFAYDASHIDEPAVEAKDAVSAALAYIDGDGNLVDAVIAEAAVDAKEAVHEALIGVGAAPSIAVGDFTFDLPVDYVAVGDDNGLELKPELGYTIADVGKVSANLLYGKYEIADAVVTVAVPEMTVGGITVPATEVSSAITNVMEVGFTFTENFDDALGLVLGVDLTDLGDDADEMAWDLDVDLSYDLGGIVPYTVVNYGSDEDLELSLGAKFDTFVNNAVITLDYTNDQVLEVTKDDETVVDALKGVITLGVKVAY